ncbi:MAG: DUF262 domain-containing HNH endonuclease family protein [Bacteroidota bacterium]|nr:DUF262 domain-containing HNH endonuclease family protein [Bacteroidota bacterium]
MDTSISTPKDLFQKDIRYTIPEFQRRYVWSLEDQWEPLWEDVCNTAEDYIEKLKLHGGNGVEAESSTRRHFLGAVVLQQVRTPTPNVEKREVIDGQQRLTTLQLLLDAVQYVCEERSAKGVKKRLLKLVENDRDILVKDEEVFKLWPTVNDRHAFTHVMDNGLATDGFKDSLIVRAHEYFQFQAGEWIGSDSDLMQARMQALEIAITGMLNMVVIDLGFQDDPHVIFETLNARGTPLLESDLVKNYVVSRTKRSGDAIWGDLDHDWWRKEIRQGRLRRPRIDALLDYWLEMQTKDDVSAGKIFSEFKRLADGREIVPIVEQAKADLSNFRRYEEGQRAPAEDVFHYRARVMQSAAFTPLLLSLLAWPEEMRIYALEALESFLVRRMVCRGTTKDYNRMALDLLRELEKRDLPQRGAQDVISFLSSRKAESRRWPTDADLEHAFLTLPLYRLLTRSRLRLVLEAIEERLRMEDRLSEGTQAPRNLTIEHILPQSWGEHWPLPGDISEIKEHQERNRLLHTIGNLTLVTNKLNPKLSNAPWKKKQETLDKHSDLRLNRQLLGTYRAEAWTERTIEMRSLEMAKLVARVWPGPEQSLSPSGNQ